MRRSPLLYTLSLACVCLGLASIGVLNGQSCCSGTAQCIDGTPVCQSNGTWTCSGGGQPCVSPEPAPCCDDCYETCTVSGWTCVGSPILIDTQGQGYHLTSLGDGVPFEMSPGTPMQVSWTNPDYQNAFLALDRNHNGTIDNGSELFGTFTPQPPSSARNGYNALAVFDEPQNGGNGNGRIDPDDAIYPSLLLWIDRNHNGISEPNELIPLASAGVFSIDLNYTLDSFEDQFGNVFRYKALVYDEHGNADPRCYDVFLQLQVGSRSR
jgi:hypothetical protein